MSKARAATGLARTLLYAADASINAAQGSRDAWESRRSFSNGDYFGGTLNALGAGLSFAGAFGSSAKLWNRYSTKNLNLVGSAKFREGFAVNPNRLRRSPEEAVALAKRHGVEIGDDIDVMFVPNSYMGKNNRAEYLNMPADLIQPNRLHTWESLLNKNGKLAVRIRLGYSISDEAIVSTLAHEMHEINSLRKEFMANGSITTRRLADLINAPDGVLHTQAIREENRILKIFRQGAE